MRNRSEIIKKRGYREDIAGSDFLLYISNYPIIAQYLGKRLGNKTKTLIELCTGVGVTLEYIGRFFLRCIGVDNDETVLNDGRKNIDSTPFKDNIQLIHGDILDEELLKSLNGDIVFYDIPFWSPHGEDKDKGNPILEKVIKNIQKYISQDIVIFSPPHMNYELIKSVLGNVEFEEVYINGKRDRIHIYMGGLVRKYGKTEIRFNL